MHQHFLEEVAWTKVFVSLDLGLRFGETALFALGSVCQTVHGLTDKTCEPHLVSHSLLVTGFQSSLRHPSFHLYLFSLIDDLSSPNKRSLLFFLRAALLLAYRRRCPVTVSAQRKAMESSILLCLAVYRIQKSRQQRLPKPTSNDISNLILYTKHVPNKCFTRSMLLLWQ